MMRACRVAFVVWVVVLFAFIGYSFGQNNNLICTIGAFNYTGQCLPGTTGSGGACSCSLGICKVPGCTPQPSANCLVRSLTPCGGTAYESGG